MKLYDPYIYLNYASLEQPVFEGYGKKNLNRLRMVSKKYDPTGLFDRLWRGYFELQ